MTTPAADAERRPAEVVHPGVHLREELEARNWTQRDLAAVMGRSPSVISAIIRGKMGISPRTAKELALALGTSAGYWRNLYARYLRWHH